MQLDKSMVIMGVEKAGFTLRNESQTLLLYFKKSFHIFVT